MQPWYIKAMWLAVVALIFGSGTSTIFASHGAREFWQFVGFVAFVLASCVTLLHNKLKFGSCFPSAKKGNRQRPPSGPASRV
jgi:hypothetical protein